MKNGQGANSLAHVLSWHGEGIALAHGASSQSGGSPILTRLGEPMIPVDVGLAGELVVADGGIDGQNSILILLLHSY